MAARPQLPGMRWLLWMRNDSLRIGIYVGVCLSCTFIVWLLIANRLPRLEPFAGVRNLIAGAVALVLLAIPLLRFRGQPVRMFVSSLTAWTLFSLAYIALELHFTLLESRMGALHLFMLGAVCYGLVAVFHWVYSICAEARHRYLAQAAQQAVPATRRRIV